MADRGGDDLRAERRARPARPEGGDDVVDAPGAGGVWSGRMVRIAAGFAAVLFGVLVWYAFDQKDESLRNAPPPLITADTEPFKVPPEDPGGMPVPHRDKTVYNALAGKKTAEVERLLPPAQQPHLPEGEREAAPSAPAPEEAPVATAEPEEPVAAAEVEKPEPVTPEPTESVAEKPAPEKTEAAPAPAPEKTEQVEAAPVKAEKTASPPIKQVYTADDAADAIDGYKIQLGAFRDLAAAKQGWETVRTRHKDLVAGLRPAIVKAQVKDKGTFYRLQAGPVKDGKAARALCEKFKSRRLGCFPVAP